MLVLKFVYSSCSFFFVKIFLVFEKSKKRVILLNDKLVLVGRIIL